MSNVAARIEAAYARQPHHMLPYIGAGYLEPRDDDLRVLALGINAYVSPKDWPPQPGWHRGWIAKSSYRYQQAVRKELEVLTAALAGAPQFAGRKYDPTRAASTQRMPSRSICRRRRERRPPS